MNQELIEDVKEWLALSPKEKAEKVQILMGIDLLSQLTKNQANIAAAQRMKNKPEKVVDFLDYKLSKLLPAEAVETAPESKTEVVTVSKPMPGIKEPITIDLPKETPEELVEEFKQVKCIHPELILLHAKLKDAETNEARKEILDLMIENEDKVKAFWNKYDQWKAGQLKLEKAPEKYKSFEGKTLDELIALASELKEKARNKQNTVNRAEKDAKKLTGTKKARKLEDLERHKSELQELIENQKVLESAIESLQSAAE